jgi:hypothetical protein
MEVKADELSLNILTIIKELIPSFADENIAGNK